MALYSLAVNCEYGVLQDEMIRDRLVVGIRDTALSKKLQLDADLTLEKAKKSIHQREAVREQQNILDRTNGANRASTSARLLGSSRISWTGRTARTSTPCTTAEAKESGTVDQETQSTAATTVTEAVYPLWEGATHAQKVPGEVEIAH